jgi:hypothetical protein
LKAIEGKGMAVASQSLLLHELGQMGISDEELEMVVGELDRPAWPDTKTLSFQLKAVCALIADM